jgi:hypothetical protein
MLLLTVEMSAVLNAVFIVISAILRTDFVPAKESPLPALRAAVIATDSTKPVLI